MAAYRPRPCGSVAGRAGVVQTNRVPPSLRSLLFVPASRPEWLAAAQAADADLMCLDLEDSVPPAGKDAARLTAVGVLERKGTGAVRINGVATRAGLADLLALADAAHAPGQVLVPMVESARDLAIVRGALGPGTVLIPLIETVAGLRAAGEIAAAPGVSAVLFGGADLAAELGVELAWEPLLTARSLVAMACAGAHVPAVDVPFLGLDDEEGLAAECGRAKALGFSGKAAIHPQQVAAINAAFGPSTEALAEARDALAAFRAGAGAAVRFRGRMLEAPIVARYRRVLAAAGEDQHA